MNEEFKNIPELQAIFSTIQDVLDLPDSSINAQTVDYMSESLNNYVKGADIKQAIEVMKDSNVSVEEYKAEAERLKEQFTEYVGAIQCSDAKKQIIDKIVGAFLDVMDDAIHKIKYDITLPFVLCNEDAKLPTYAHDTDSGADVYAPAMIRIPAHSLSTKVPTGLKLALPRGWEIQIRMRSSVAMKTGLRLSNSIATIDQDYRGELILLFDNFSDEDYIINMGDRIAQLVLNKTYHFEAEEVKAFEDTTERSEGGFGSSGK